MLPLHQLYAPTRGCAPGPMARSPGCLAEGAGKNSAWLRPRTAQILALPLSGFETEDKLFQFTEPQFPHLEGAAAERILPQCLLPAVMLVPITSTCCLLNIVTNQYDVGVMGAGLGTPSH